MSSLADYFTNQVRGVKFSTFYDRVVRELGLSSATWSPSDSSLSELICDYMTERYRKAYEADWWPMLTPVVARGVVDDDRGKYVPFLQEYSTSGALVVSGAGTAAVNGFYEVNGAVNSRSKWELTNAAATVLAYLQWDGVSQWELYDGDDVHLYTLAVDVQIPVSGSWTVESDGTAPGPVTNQFYEPMDSIRWVTEVDPRLKADEQERVSWGLSPRGIELPADLATDTVWVEYRLRPPVLTRTAYAGGTTYAQDDVVYDSTTGECYRSLQDSNIGNAVTSALFWERQYLPALFNRYVAKAVSSDWMRKHGDDQSSVDRESGRAAAELERLQLVARPQQRQFETVTVSIP